MAEPLYTVRYFDGEWQEMEHLRVEDAGASHVHACFCTWFEFLADPDGAQEVIAQGLGPVALLQVEVQHEEG